MWLQLLMWISKVHRCFLLLLYISECEDEFQFPRVRVELVFEISPDRHAVLMRGERDIEINDKQRHNTSNLHHGEVLPNAVVRPWDNQQEGLARWIRSKRAAYPWRMEKILFYL